MWWIPAAMGAIQFGAGLWQSSQAKKAAAAAKRKAESLRPGIPKDVERMLSRAERAAMEGMPLRSMYEETVRQSTASGVAALREGSVSSSEYLSGVTDVYANELREMNRVATQDAMIRMQQEEEVRKGLLTRAEYDYKSQMMAYGDAKEEYGMAGQAYTSGVQNMWGGLQSIAGAFMTKWSSNQQLEALKTMYGEGGAQPKAMIPKVAKEFTKPLKPAVETSTWATWGDTYTSPIKPLMIGS